MKLKVNLKNKEYPIEIKIIQVKNSIKRLSQGGSKAMSQLKTKKLSLKYLSPQVDWIKSNLKYDEKINGYQAFDNPSEEWGAGGGELSRMTHPGLMDFL